MKITVNGRDTAAAAGTSVAATLLNAGITTFRASPCGESRTPLCGMGTCFECRVTIDGEPHRRACLETVRAGMDVHTDTPSAFAAKVVKAGVAANGLDDDVAALDWHVVDADVAVIGAGPAGIAAAVTAAAHGMRVVLVDAAPRAGGQIWRNRADAREPDEASTGASVAPPSRTSALPSSARHWLARLRHSTVTHLAGVDVVSAVPANGGFVLVLEHVNTPSVAEPVRAVRAARLIIATGARELFLPFPGWTQPGVVGVGGAQALLKAGWNVRGRRAVVAGSGPLLLPVAAALARAGACVVEVAEQAPRAAVLRFATSLWRNPSRLADAVLYRAAFAGTPYHAGTWAQRAHGAGALQGLTLTDGRRERHVACDLLCTGFGLTPATELGNALGCLTRRGAVVVDDDQRTSVPGIFCAGEPTGIAGADAAIVQGRIAGLAATGVGVPSRLARRRAATAQAAARLRDAFALRRELAALAGADTIVCRCEDVRFGEISGYGGAREAKLVTRMAMGACQGRVCGPAAGHLLDWTRDTVREPLFPARIDTMIDYGSDHEEE